MVQEVAYHPKTKMTMAGKTAGILDEALHPQVVAHFAIAAALLVEICQTRRSLNEMAVRLCVTTRVIAFAGATVRQ